MSRGRRQEVPASLVDPGLVSFWRDVRLRLDRDGASLVRTMRMPFVDARSSLALTTLLGRSPTKRLDLSALEEGLRRSGVGSDLDAALTRLGHPPDVAVVEAREARTRSAQARAVLEQVVGRWPEAWAWEWGEELRAAGVLAGLDAADVEALLGDVRRLVDCAAELQHNVRLRAEVAAELFGSSHALDSGTKLASAAERVLPHLLEATHKHLGGRALWEAAGFLADAVSAPVLTWGLRPQGDSPLSVMLNCAAEGGLPLHLSLRLLRTHRIEIAAETPVLVVENPSVVEAAVSRRVPFGLVCTNGNPSTAVTELLSHMASAGVALHYHGDFDAAGIAICRRMHERGCDPWMMSASDYLAALDRANAHRVALQHDPKKCGPTPWDPALEHTFEDRRCIVHEELIVDEVLQAFEEALLS